jgi:hypothetical protein
VLVFVTILAAALSHVGEEHAVGSHASPGLQPSSTAASADDHGTAQTGKPGESGVEYAPTLGDELPDADDLLGEPAEATLADGEPSAPEPDTGASDPEVEHAPTLGDELPDVEALLGESGD